MGTCTFCNERYGHLALVLKLTKRPVAASFIRFDGNKTHGAVLESEEQRRQITAALFRLSFRVLGLVPKASGVKKKKKHLGPRLLACFFSLSLTVDPRRSCAPRLNGIGGAFLALYL
jgi:hypothetical protein